VDDQEAMTITVKFFALTRDLAQMSETLLDLPAGAGTDDALAKLISQFPQLASIRPRLAIAVNQTYVRQNHLLSDGDELALIPPVSGG
jgi:molybdopterin converting factor subunit 1